MSKRVRIPNAVPAPPPHPDSGSTVSVPCASCRGALIPGELAAELEDGRLEHVHCWLQREALEVLPAMARALEGGHREVLELRELLEARRLRSRARRVLEALRERLRGGL